MMSEHSKSRPDRIFAGVRNGMNRTVFLSRGVSTLGTKATRAQRQNGIVVLAGTAVLERHLYGLQGGEGVPQVHP